MMEAMTRSSALRSSAIAHAHTQFDNGSFRELLARRIGIATESQNPQRTPELAAYLRSEIQPAFEATGRGWDAATVAVVIPFRWGVSEFTIRFGLSPPEPGFGFTTQIFRFYCGRAAEARVGDYANVTRRVNRPYASKKPGARLLLYFATSPTPTSTAITVVPLQRLNIPPRNCHGRGFLNLLTPILTNLTIKPVQCRFEGFSPSKSRIMCVTSYQQYSE